VAPRRKVTIQVPSRQIAVPVGVTEPGQMGIQQGMGRLTLPVVNFTGADATIDLTGGGQLRRPAKVKVGNLSGYVLEVTLLTHRDHLRASETNVFDSMGATTMHLHAVGGTGLGTGTIIVAVAPDGVDFPGTWPIMNNRPTSTGNQQALGSVTAAAGTISNVSFLVDPATTAIGWIEDETAPGNPHAFILTGNTTLETYFQQFETDPGFGDGSGLFVVKVPTVEEPAGFTFELDATGHSQCRAFLFAFLDTSSVNVRQNSTEFWNVTSVGSFPADWQVPNDISTLNNPQPVQVSVSLAAGATSVLVTGNPPARLRLFEIGYTIDEAAAAGRLLAWQAEGSGLTFWQDSFVSSTGYRTFDYHGGQVDLSTGTFGIQIKNNGSVSITPRGTMGVSS
jgi:hypothetical protein